MEDIFIVPRPILPGGAPAAGTARNPDRPKGSSFDQVFGDQLRKGEALKFSRHALSRMESRGIKIGSDEMARLRSAVDLVNTKGGKESLVLLDEKALVVSIKNGTVVTLVDKENLRGNVFTHIDSAVIA
jgi:flagellar operon protein